MLNNRIGRMRRRFSFTMVWEEIGQVGSDGFVMLLGDLNGHVEVVVDGYEGVH